MGERADLATTIKALWNFDDPSASRAAFELAAAETDGTERSILLTQAARATGLSGDFAAAEAILDQLPTTFDTELQARIELERGRLYNDQQRPSTARAHFQCAADLTANHLDQEPLGGVHIDAVHMVALTLDSPAEQIAATQRALGAADRSADPTARAWRASLLNNLGCAQVDANLLTDALITFQQAQTIRQQAGERRAEQIARWMIAWTLRLLGRRDEARAMQLALRADLAADGIDDQYVDEELALLDASQPHDEA